MTQFVSYLRVSTSKQGRSGLGLAAQRSKIDGFLSSDDVVIAEFIEAQSGKSDKREELWKALHCAKRNSAKLLIAKLDRFSRKVSFIARIMDEGVSLAVADMPNASDFQLHIFAALAQEERRLISERTKAALAEAKRRGTELGKNGKLLAKQNKAKAKMFADEIWPFIGQLVYEGASLASISRHLNSVGLRTARGNIFYPQTVRNVLKARTFRLKSDGQP